MKHLSLVHVQFTQYLVLQVFLDEVIGGVIIADQPYLSGASERDRDRPTSGCIEDATRRQGAVLVLIQERADFAEVKGEFGRFHRRAGNAARNPFRHRKGRRSP